MNQISEIYPELAKEKSSWRYIPLEETLRGKNILVTGAGDGIGLAISKTFACYGANILLLGKTRAKLEEAFDWITENTSTHPIIIPCDSIFRNIYVHKRRQIDVFFIVKSNHF